MPDTRPGIKFDDEGICQGCRTHEEKKYQLFGILLINTITKKYLKMKWETVSLKIPCGDKKNLKLL